MTLPRPYLNFVPPVSGNVTVTVDGIPATAQAGELLIDLLNRLHAAGNMPETPQVCYLKSMGPIQSCDTCLVQIDGALARACGKVVAEGMQVVTQAAHVQAAQRQAFDRILGNHQLYCTVCDNNNHNCTVHNTTALLDVQHQAIPYRPKPYAVDMSNPFYRYDPDQCILCGRCVEACQNVQVNETLSIAWERDAPRVLWDGGEQIEGSSCVSCGHCVTVCPCNALMEKSMLGEAGYLTRTPAAVLDDMIEVVKGVEPAIGYGPILALSEMEAAMRDIRIRKTKTVCTYCAVGCSFDVWTKDRHILKIEPGPGPANGISTCIKGKFAWGHVNSSDRLTTPLLRTGEGFREATWDEALDLIEKRFKQIRYEHGPDALAFIASSKCTNEESYLMQKLARAVVGTNNIDNCARYCQNPATMGLQRTVGYGGDSGSIADIEQAGLVLILGANPAENHPVLATRIKRSHKHRGQRLIVADLRRHEMAERADLFFRPRPATDGVWLCAVAREILHQGWAKQEFITQWVTNFDAYAASLEPYTLQHAEAVTGVPVATLQQLAREIAFADGVCILFAMGVTQHCGGSDTATSLSNLLLLTGNYMRPGAGAYPLRGHNNVQGASDFGSMPHVFPGYQLVADDAIRQKFEAAWGVDLPTRPGKDNHQMMDAILDGTLRSLYIKGEDTITSDSNANYVAQALSSVDFLVVQDINFSETAQFADVVLPAAVSLEKEGTFTSTERRIQRLYQAMEPLGASRPDWEILQQIANRLGAGWTYAHPSEIMAEAASLTPLFAGVSYERLAGYRSLQWPVAADGTDSPVLFTQGFPFPDGKARFFPVHHTAPAAADEQYDLHLNNGRMLEHFEQGSMTYRTAGIAEIAPAGFVEVSPQLAAERGLETGRYVQLTSAYGQARVRVLVSDRVKGHQLYMSLNSVTEPVNRLTSSETDSQTHTPAYKETAVRMTVLPETGASPLPRSNFRFGKRTPQAGVEVERKWRRADYRLPGRDAALVHIQPAKP
ncbi:MAG: formate dehydrogenase subunit alpha [Acidobacteriota bacterium]|nr:formate dehydrogenase subunit alpha [Acidobacteriota bacterium]